MYTLVRVTCKMLVFYFESIVMWKEYLFEKSFKVLGYRDVPAFEIFFKELTTNGTISEAGKDFIVVKKACQNKPVTKGKSPNVIRKATAAFQDEDYILTCTERLNHFYHWADFNVKARFGILRVAVMQIPLLAELAMLQSISTNGELEKIYKRPRDWYTCIKVEQYRYSRWCNRVVQKRRG